MIFYLHPLLLFAVLVHTYGLGLGRGVVSLLGLRGQRLFD
jgi:hypothetical protein